MRRPAGRQVSAHQTADGELAAVELEAIRLNALTLFNGSPCLCEDEGCRRDTALWRSQVELFLRGLAAS